MGISVLFSFAGLIVAYILYVSKPYLPEKVAALLGSFYDAVVNKYYVDEFTPSSSSSLWSTDRTAFCGKASIARSSTTP